MKRWLVGGGLVVAVVAAASAWAAIPGPNGVINACYVKNIGILRVIDEGRRCSQFETPLAWNAQGVPGVSGYQIVNVSKTLGPFAGGGSVVEIEARCPAGKKVVGGGGSAFIRVGDSAALTQADLLASEPDLDDFWVVNFGKVTGAGFTAQETMRADVYAICVNVAS